MQLLYSTVNNHYKQELVIINWMNDSLTHSVCLKSSHSRLKMTGGLFCFLCPADRTSLQAAHCVEKMQELILDLLSRVCGAQAGAARGGPQRFGRLLGRLTELRTLHHNYLLLSRQQPGLWWRERTRNSGKPPQSSLGNFLFELKDQTALFVLKYCRKMVFTGWLSGERLQFSQLTSVCHWILTSNGTEVCLSEMVCFDKIYYSSFYNCCIQLTCTLNSTFYYADC